MVGTRHWVNDSPGTSSLEVSRITAEKAQNGAASEDMGFASKDKQVLVHCQTIRFGPGGQMLVTPSLS